MKSIASSKLNPIRLEKHKLSWFATNWNLCFKTTNKKFKIPSLIPRHNNSSIYGIKKIRPKYYVPTRVLIYRNKGIIIRERKKEKEKEKERERLTCFDGVLERVMWKSKWNTTPSFICFFFFFFFSKKKKTENFYVWEPGWITEYTHARTASTSRPSFLFQCLLRLSLSSIFLLQSLKQLLYKVVVVVVVVFFCVCVCLKPYSRVWSGSSVAVSYRKRKELVRVRERKGREGHLWERKEVSSCPRLSGLDCDEATTKDDSFHLMKQLMDNLNK